MKSLLMNRRGSILQIVLIVFMLLTLALSITSFYILQSASQLHSISLLLKQKNLEIFLVKYYSDTVQNDILLSDDYSFNDNEVISTVDDLGNYYEVTTFVQTKQMQYSFLVWVEVDTGAILKFEYV
ncbi:hypothetical protein [Massilimicrobiota sp. An80]|uniref:hypothetical protein n=1 Tax=Massilimicrobiota sp. An80 TaxID=1965658 RepID=UPI000B448CB6|nr:hypothetical protein [Massilimicrobiota sp. An80]OUN36596.1 hypothetical protein B5G32_07345 [Massilimicrobiota sp. An80]